jgi:hypothetical protein
MDKRGELAREMLALTYARFVERAAREAFDTGRVADFLAVVDRVNAHCEVEPVSDALVARLSHGLDDPYDRFRLRALLYASAIWEVGGWVDLIGSLRRAFDPNCPANRNPVRRAHGPVRRRPPRRTRHPPTG